MKFARPQCLCSVELTQRIPEILRCSGFSVTVSEPRLDSRGVKVVFDYAVSDGVRRVHLIGVSHKEIVIALLSPVRSGLKPHGLLAREKFASAVIDCLLREGASKPPPPNEEKLRHLAERGDKGAKMMLDEFLRQKRKKA